MSARPTVSVALCTHNGARYIRQQVESILAQTRPPEQVVVSDDASTDGTVEILRAVWRERGADTHTELIVLENPVALGVTRNFEQAVRVCTSDLIALSDQDDVWHPDKLASMTAEFEAHQDLGLAFTDARLVGAHGAHLGPCRFGGLAISGNDLEAIHAGRAFQILLRRNLATGATMMFRRAILDSALPFDDAWVHDEWLTVVAAAVSRVDWVRGQTIDYRQHGSNQIGVSAPTLRYKVRRVLQPRGDRNRGLKTRAEHLLDRLVALDVDPDRLLLMRAKLAHETHRASLPDLRIARVVPVLKEARTGRYSRYSSQGLLDIVRDLLQPAR